MNFNLEKYPENIADLLTYADVVAKKILLQLDSPSCKKVGDLYKVANGKIIREKNKFEELGYSANESSEFKGLYIFGEEIDGRIIPVYIGISRSVIEDYGNTLGVKNTMNVRSPI